MRPAHLLMGHAHNAETSDMALTLVATPLMRRKGVRFDASGPLSALDGRMQPVNAACPLCTAHSFCNGCCRRERRAATQRNLEEAAKRRADEEREKAAQRYVRKSTSAPPGLPMNFI